MPRPIPVLAAFLLAAAAIHGANAQEAAPPIAADPVRPGKPARVPYLAPGALDTTAVLPPPPPPGSEAARADKAAYDATRALKDTPRWHLATHDVASGVASLLDDFSCSIGRRLDPARLPVLIGVLERARLDVVEAVRRPKEVYRRERPHLGNDAPICVARTEPLARSPSYPSGHTTEGWTFALILAAAMPEHATAILRRGRIYGESRIVCGVHWPSDVEAGRDNGAALFAALQGSAAFRADLDAARAELAAILPALGAADPDPATCAMEAAAAGKPVP
ncbi:acid phosphatase [Methylobacterium oryzihabitans]|uniref:Acid phosphatase n=1 Tax=Methylobacterium oryzihabitans TaxID=2499852 RepID=A0A3S2WFJ4_9HYPH|nr:phosphatase PAP2 family protein [Methylobacterium oryzihabitans]RVU21133.1 phosphatase PAP2 family protein [Methylobacterium oryzihabitans]